MLLKRIIAWSNENVIVEIRCMRGRLEEVFSY
jgi:hypothetical protein